MKKIMFMAIPILLLAACTKEVRSDDANQANSESDISEMIAKGRTTFPIFNSLQSDPDPNPTTECGGALTYGNMTFLGKCHGISVNKTCTYSTDGTELAITSDDITYGANGNELWTKGDIVIHFPTDGSTVATITGGSTIVGGTGRYAGATGFLIYENMVYDLVTGHESHTTHGKITFVR
jgi:hypothetical protein